MTHEVGRTSEIPNHVISMGCNWCPSCEDDADEYYEEWYNDSDNNDTEPTQPINQLGLFTLWPNEKTFEEEKVKDEKHLP